MLRAGHGVEQDVDKLIEWAGIAALNGNEKAAGWLLNGYDKGSDDGFIQPDKAKLLEWADKLSAAGNNVGRAYYAELYMRKDPAFEIITSFDAFERVSKGADENSACLIHAYFIGSFLAGVQIEMGIYDYAEKILVKLLDWQEHPALEERNDLDEQKAGVWYMYGRCLWQQNRDSEAQPWLKKAIPWNANAEIIYGVCLGDVARRTKKIDDFADSATHLLHAVDRKLPKDKRLEAAACRLIALQARLGLGVKMDMNASYSWMQRAAEGGDEDAQAELKRYHKKLFGGYTYR